METGRSRDFEGVLRAGFVWTGRRLVRRGGLFVQGGVVAALLGEGDPDPPGAEAIDLPRALLHPGLLDAHAHLDLSGLRGAIPPGLPFPRWLGRVREGRAAAGEGGLLAAARAGAAELVASGATGVVDFSYGGHSEAALRESGLRSVVLREVIGPDPRRAAEAEAAAREWLASREPGGLVSHGLAPHSVYLATGELIQACRRLCGKRPFSIHAAEIPAERTLVREGSGELAELLESLGAAPEAPRPDCAGPVERLSLLGALEGALLVHGNSLAPTEVGLLQRQGAAVVFCPRSHLYFDRPPHPLPRLLAEGVGAALGTDSAASNPGLSMAEEMRVLCRLFPGLAAEEVFALGTGSLLGRSLGLRSWGSLEPGAAADLAAAEIPPATAQPLRAFLGEPSPNVLTAVGGRILFEAR